ncbi:MAG: PIN domain-containing protein [Lachnospiraceae bacterium]|nr:PIN domain-containing protein [Lachnospiraceae bacterium]
MAYYLIDFENVKSRGMEGVELLTEEDTVCIFYSDNADSMTFDLHRKLNETKANIIYHKVAVGTKNALDFQLATYLGYLICGQQNEGIHPNYFIVTKDNGFTSLMVYWKAQGVPVRIIRNLLWGKNPVAEQNLLIEEEQETETAVTTAEDVTEQPTTEEEQTQPIQPERVDAPEEPVQPEPEKADAPEESAQPEPETVDESAQPVKKPSRKKNNTRKKSAAKTDDKTEEKKPAEKKPAEKKSAEEPDELTLAVEKVLTDQTIVPQVVKFIRQYKTKQGINNALNKEFKDSKRTSEIYSAIKPLIADKKGK